MKLSALLAPLIAAKVPHEVIMETVLAYEAEQTDALETSREKARARWHKWKSKSLTSVGKRLPTVSNTLAHVEDNISNSEIEPHKKHTHTDLAEFKAALSGECDEKRVDEFVKLRRKKRGTLTGHAADLFKADAKACGLSLPDAVDTCISRNWITVKSDWLSRPNARAGPVRSNPLSDAFGQLAQMQRDTENDQSPEPVSSSVRYLSAASR